MSAFVFALWMFMVADPYSGNAMQMPLEVSLNVYAEAQTWGVDPAIMGGLLMHEHPGGGADKFLTPFKESSTGAVGMFQLKGVWFNKAREDWGYEDLTWEDFSQDGTLQTGIAVRMVERMERRHGVHAKDGEHTMFAHWSCGNSSRADGVRWDGDDPPQCSSSVKRVERRIEAASMWRLVGLPVVLIDSAGQTLLSFIAYDELEAEAGESSTVSSSMHDLTSTEHASDER